MFIYGMQIMAQGLENAAGSKMKSILEVLTKNKLDVYKRQHLVSVNERIQIDRIPVSDDIFYEVFCEAYRTAKEMEQEGLTHPSYFEFLFGMGMLAFEKTQVEYVILETGLGGRLDATNSVCLLYTSMLKVWITLINPPFIGFLLFDYPILYRKKTLSGQ